MTISSGAGGSMYGFLACTASQFMTSTVITVERQTTIRQLGALFEQHDFNAFPVVENGRILGLVTKFDFLRTFAFTSSQMAPRYDDLMSRQVEDVMTEAIVHVDPTLPLTRVLQLMVSLKMRCFPVMTPDRQLVGMNSREDVMRALKETTAAAFQWLQRSLGMFGHCLSEPKKQVLLLVVHAGLKTVSCQAGMLFAVGQSKMLSCSLTIRTQCNPHLPKCSRGH